MKIWFLCALIFPLTAWANPEAKTALTTSPPATSANSPTQAADFSVRDAGGKPHTLGDYKGHWLVLEWYNKDCPYVRKHYDSKNMQSLQKKYMDKGVSWVTVISSAKGKQGYLMNAEIEANFTREGAGPTNILIDDDGKMGKAYGAKTTPQMYVINPEGVLIYSGAIDDNSSADPKTAAAAKNYVAAVLDRALAGKPVKQKNTTPYGCPVKYN